jgi:hypothetical protein
VLRLPAPWAVRREGPLSIWTQEGTGVRVEVDPLVPLPDDRKAWGERVLGRDLPPGGAVTQTDLVNTTGSAGWPATVVSSVVRDAAGVAVEARTTFFYEMLLHGVALVCRVPAVDVQRWEQELRPILVEAMLAAEADFRSAEVAHIGELWEMTPTEEP